MARRTPSRLPLSESTTNLFENCRILYLVVLREQDDLRKDFRSLGIIIRKWQEQTPAVLSVDWHDAQMATGLTMDDSAAQMDIVFAQPTVDQGVAFLNSYIAQVQQCAGLAQQRRSHFHR